MRKSDSFCETVRKSLAVGRRCEFTIKSKIARPGITLEAPLPVIEGRRGTDDAPEEPGPPVLPSGEVDEEALEVMKRGQDGEELDEEYTPTIPSLAHKRPRSPSAEVLEEEGHVEIPVEQGEAAPKTPEIPDAAMLEERKRFSDSPLEEAAKAPKRSTEGGPTSSGLYSPFNAGQVVEISHDDELWEEGFEWF